MYGIFRYIDHKNQPNVGILVPSILDTLKEYKLVPEKDPCIPKHLLIHIHAICCISKPGYYEYKKIN